MNTEKLCAETADKIMALIDENPTEPFSFERRNATSRLIYLLRCLIERCVEEDDAAYMAGQEEGYFNAKQDFECEIEDLEQELRQARQELESAERNLADALTQIAETDKH